MAAVTTDPLQRLEEALRVGTNAPRKRMLVIVNPYATTVSDRLKNLVVYALRGRYDVESIDTTSIRWRRITSRRVETIPIGSRCAPPRGSGTTSSTIFRRRRSCGLG